MRERQKDVYRRVGSFIQIEDNAIDANSGALVIQ